APSARHPPPIRNGSAAPAPQPPPPSSPSSPRPSAPEPPAHRHHRALTQPPITLLCARYRRRRHATPRRAERRLHARWRQPALVTESHLVLCPTSPQRPL